MSPSQSSIVHVTVRVDETRSNDLVCAVDHGRGDRRNNVRLYLCDLVILDK